MIQITDHLANIERRVATTLARTKRPDKVVMIVAVSKRQGIEAIARAGAAGQQHFGENYLQEAIEKMDALADQAVAANFNWHFIGTIQTNKTRLIAERFDWVHTVDRPRIAERLNSQRPLAMTPLNVLIQVNLAAEPQKGGIAAEGLTELSEYIGELPQLRLRGLTCIPPAANTEDDNRRYFNRMHDLARELHRLHPSSDTLSMGMSNDFELAIECGSNCVRIGTAIFGQRSIAPS